MYLETTSSLSSIDFIFMVIFFKRDLACIYKTWYLGSQIILFTLLFRNIRNAASFDASSPSQGAPERIWIALPKAKAVVVLQGIKLI